MPGAGWNSSASTGLSTTTSGAKGVRDCSLGKGSLGNGKPGAHPTLAVGLGVSISALSTQGAISERLTFPCPFCEAAFTPKTQLRSTLILKLIWTHPACPQAWASQPASHCQSAGWG